RSALNVSHRLLVASRVVDVPRSSNPIVVTLSSLKPFFFDGLQEGGALFGPWWSLRPRNPIRAKLTKPHHRCGDEVFFAWLPALVQGVSRAGRDHARPTWGVPLASRPVVVNCCWPAACLLCLRRQGGTTLPASWHHRPSASRGEPSVSRVCCQSG